MKKVAILQSSYIPWKGYFDLINSVDEFIFYDDMQFTKRDWRSRNAIKTQQGTQWLTIPVNVKGKYLQKINEVTVVDTAWAKKHWTAISYNYAQAPYFRLYRDIVREVYDAAEQEAYLSKINYLFIKLICDLLSIKTRLTWSTEYPAEGSKTERLVSLCKASGATDYLSGPSARDYIKPELFAAANVNLTYYEYDGYLAYAQLFGEFNHYVTILDLLFNVGEQAKLHMKSFNKL